MKKVLSIFALLTFFVSVAQAQFPSGYAEIDYVYVDDFNAVGVGVEWDLNIPDDYQIIVVVQISTLPDFSYSQSQTYLSNDDGDDYEFEFEDLEYETQYYVRAIFTIAQTSESLITPIEMVTTGIHITAVVDSVYLSKVGGHRVLMNVQYSLTYPLPGYFVLEVPNPWGGLSSMSHYVPMDEQGEVVFDLEELFWLEPNSTYEYELSFLGLFAQSEQETVYEGQFSTGNSQRPVVSVSEIVPDFHSTTFELVVETGDQDFGNYFAIVQLCNNTIEQCNIVFGGVLDPDSVHVFSFEALGDPGDEFYVTIQATGWDGTQDEIAYFNNVDPTTPFIENHDIEVNGNNSIDFMCELIYGGAESEVLLEVYNLNTDELEYQYVASYDVPADIPIFHISDETFTPGQYYARFTSVNEYGSDVEVRVFVIDAVVGVEEVVVSGWGVYPNPVRDILTITGDNLTTVDVYTSAGVLYQSIVFPSGISQKQIDVSGWSSGFYIMKSGNKTLRLIVE